MELDKYLKHFKDWGLKTTEAHVAFEIKTGTPNPDFPENHAWELENTLLHFRDEEAYPGVQYRRDGLKFIVDVVSYQMDGHLDYMDRLLLALGVYGKGDGFIEPLSNQLPSGDKRISL